jgi:flavodoxin
MMKTLVVDYSLTGNNRRLADRIVSLLSADRDSISSARTMKPGAIALDRLFGLSPKIADSGKLPGDYDLVILVGPVWMGKIASPFRPYIKKHHGAFKKIAFVSISGGALGPNSGVEKEIAGRTGLKPAVVQEFYTNDLIPEEERKKMSKTSTYQLTDDDIAGPLKAGIDELAERLRASV